MQEGRRIASGGPFSLAANWAPRRHIALLGMPGSGKTTVGRLLAAATGRVFVDTDEWIVRAARMSVPAIFRRHGEAVFRGLEGEALDVLGELPRAVLSVGGGLVTVPGHARRLRELALCVALEVPLQELIRRLGPEAGRARPLLRGPGGAPARLAALFEERSPLYRACSHLAMSPGGLGPEEAAAILARHLRQFP